MDNVLSIGNDKQVLLNAQLCERSENIRLTMHQPTRTGELLLEPEPDERERGLSIGSYSCVRQEGGLTRLWYFLNSRKSIHDRRLCYAESTDGIHFTRPAIAQGTNDGTSPRNAVLDAPIQGGCVWLDPKAPPAQRYRTQAKWGPPEKFAGKGSTLHFYASPDGLAWSPTHYLHLGDCDTQNLIFFDDRLGRYVMYTRQWERFDDHNLNCRKVRRLESDDLIAWDHEQVVWEPDAVDLARCQTSVNKPPVDCYGACVFKYPDAGDFYVMLAQHFWHWQDRTEAEKWGFSPDPENLERRIVHLGPATLDVRLGYSLDGIAFSRAVDRGPFMPVGPAGCFDSRSVWLLPNPVVRDDQIWFYYAGNNRDHDGFVDPAAPALRSGIGRAILRRDGFVSADADHTGGRLTTPLLTFAPGELELNVAASSGGSIQVELLDADDRPIDGFSGDASPFLCGDSVRLPVRWTGGGADQLAGQPVRLRFNLREARLHAFQVVAR